MRIITSAVLAMCAAAPAFAMDDATPYWRVDALAEKRITALAPATEWNVAGWFGGDAWKLRLQNEGVLSDDGRIDNEGGTKGIASRLFVSRAISDFWDAKAGVELSVFDAGQSRSAFVAGVEGLVPYGIHLDAIAGVSQTGTVFARLEAAYDVLLSQKLVAQPFAEAMAASQDDRPIGLGAGLPRFETGLRLRYEIEKEIAPFVGVSFEQFTGNTASFVAAGGGATSSVRALVGVKLWF
jgi:copper resistance protein B